MVEWQGHKVVTEKRKSKLIQLRHKYLLGPYLIHNAGTERFLVFLSLQNLLLNCTWTENKLIIFDTYTGLKSRRTIIYEKTYWSRTRLLIRLYFGFFTINKNIFQMQWGEIKTTHRGPTSGRWNTFSSVRLATHAPWPVRRWPGSSQGRTWPTWTILVQIA